MDKEEVIKKLRGLASDLEVGASYLVDVEYTYGQEGYEKVSVSVQANTKYEKE